MLITRKTKVPTHWVFYAQIPFVMAIVANFATGAPFIFALKKFIDNTAAISFLLSIEVTITVLGGPFAAWLSDRVWTRYGRRKIFVVISNIPQAAALIAMPFAPNLMYLLVCRWIYGIFGDIGTPNQALTMEVVPSKQRGLGSGFFNAQINFCNLVFWWLVFGRLDDVYFTGPFRYLSEISGEILVFCSAGLLLLAICFYTFYGIHEVEPPNRKTLDDERRSGENFIVLFARTFFKDVLSKDLLPLYLLMLIGTLTSVGLGVLGPLLFTEQWGFTKQQMGNNFAVGAAYGILLSLFSGWIADRTSKIRVYTIALILALIAKIAWTIYVSYQPDHRPSLTEVIVFGNIQFTFSTLAGVVAFPLLLEYVERNRLGSAAAGQALFSGLIKNGFTMFVGSYVLVWSIFFLPQAGDRVEMVFRDSLTHETVLEKIHDPVLLDELHLEAMHRPGVDGETSRHWKIRRAIEGAGEIHAHIKDLRNQIGNLANKMSSPLNSEAEIAEYQTEIEALKEKQSELQAQLNESVREFETRLRQSFGEQLTVNGEQIVEASVSDDGSGVTLLLEVIEPVTGELSEEIRTALDKLEQVFDTVDLQRVSSERVNEFKPDLSVEPVDYPVNGIRIEMTRDPDFVALELALANAGYAIEPVFNTASDLLILLRGLAGEETGNYSLSEINVQPSDSPQMDFQLEIHSPAPSQIPTESDMAALFENFDTVQAAEIDGDFPSYDVTLQLSPLARADAVEGEIYERFKDLLPNATETEIRAIKQLYQRSEATLASHPFFLNTTRPIILSQPADREYDYFFSVQYFMIGTDVFGIFIIGLIVYLERRGTIRRRGVEEDERREPTANA